MLKKLGWAFAAATLAFPALLAAQTTSRKTGDTVPELDVAITYDATLSRDITSKNFWMQGGAVEVHGRFYGGLGVVADVAGMHIGDINSSGVGLDLVTATFGPRYTWSPRGGRYAIFAQGLGGVANGFNGIFPSLSGFNTVANSMAVQAGGGMNVNLKPHLALRVFDVNWMRTQFPNSTSNVQNHVRFGTGLVLRFR